MSCGKEHQKRRVRLLVKFGNAEAGTVVEAELCPNCGVKVTSKQLGYDDCGWYMIPSALAEIVEDLKITGRMRRQPKHFTKCFWEFSEQTVNVRKVKEGRLSAGQLRIDHERPQGAP